MKRWDDFLREEPSLELNAAIESAALKEMNAARGSRRWWLQLAGVSVALAAVVGGYRLIRKEMNPAGDEPQLLELAEDEALDLESLEDLDVIEILEELEEWQNG